MRPIELKDIQSFKYLAIIPFVDGHLLGLSNDQEYFIYFVVKYKSKTPRELIREIRKFSVKRIYPKRQKYFNVSYVYERANYATRGFSSGSATRGS